MKLFKNKSQLFRTLLCVGAVVTTTAIATPLIVSCSNTSSNGTTPATPSPAEKNKFKTNAIFSNWAFTTSDRDITKNVQWVYDNIFRKKNELTNKFKDHPFGFGFGRDWTLVDNKWTLTAISNDIIIRYDSASLIRVTDKPQNAIRDADYITLKNVSIDCWRLGVYQTFNNLGDVNVYSWNELEILFPELSTIDDFDNNCTWMVNADLRKEIMGINSKL